jgi:hypothetical protein
MSKTNEPKQPDVQDSTPLATEAKAVQEFISQGEYSQLIEQHGLNRLPRFNPIAIQKSEEVLTTTEIIDLLKTKSNNRKFDRQFAGQTPDWSQKNPTEERDVESWGEARQRKDENRAFGLPEENDLTSPTPLKPNAPKQSRGKFLVNPVQIAAEVESPEANDKKPEYLEGWASSEQAKRYKAADAAEGGEAAGKQRQRNRYLAWKNLAYKQNYPANKYPEAIESDDPPKITNEYLGKEGTGGHGVGDTAGAQVANGMAGLASGGTAHISTNAGIFTATHGGSRGKKIRRTNDGSHTVGEENFTKRGTHIPALTEYVKKQFLDKAKAPYYNRDVQGLNTSTIRDQKSQKRQSKQNNMAGNKRTSIWRNP